ncbi:MAG: MBL fold metallo-hydrolase [Pseudomonadales bacterium]|nr:MBL fold metallo-hydrolase [Pseudomonadales bacterium]MBO6566563.1 MBL fold metallo-hydrolase [Pseudomonadales bacterium]MBO6594749.1 MBL fold metallo-hydrolase [Pseudomonadales bacterium]MBO6701255.1 MBL fold metallo-hydrolase [Pseudomonadales bacterium]MBO6821691.1 MBL fold metallo-hydrolase [Pseudomonadales bacterium]
MKKLILMLVLAFSSQAYSHSGPEVPEPMNLDSLVKAFGWDFEKMEITTEKVADDLYVLFGVGGNIAVNVGDDGVFIVDDQFPQMMPKILKAISDIGGDGDVDFAVTTHWHFDHAEGNLALGPDGTWLVAHENSREMMKGDHIINLVVAAYEQKAYPESAWPDITYDDDMQFHVNGQSIDLWHFGPAHTTGDTAVYFQGTNAVHLGDVFNNSGYPFIDAGNGGTLEGVIKFCSETLKRINEDTVVIPGHGPITDYQALVDYVDMLSVIRDRMLAMIDDGATLEDVYAAGVTADYDEKMGNSIGFVNRAYMSLTHRRTR